MGAHSCFRWAMVAAVCSGWLLHADTRYYRYSLTNYHGDPDFQSEVTGTQQRYYDYYTVTRDDAGRMVKSAYTKQGTETGSSVYFYDGSATRYTSIERYTAGKFTGRTKITRDDAGDPTRYDYYTTGGELTGYTVADYRPGAVERHSYNAGGKETAHSISAFDSRDVLFKTTTINDEHHFSESDYSTATGWTQATRQYVDGKLDVKTVYTYDADGRVTKREGYRADDSLLAVDLFANDLRVRRTYYLADKTIGKELASSYDSDQRVSEVRLSYKGVLVCTLTYERRSDGTVVKTVAKGPDGSLWAEYPDRAVMDISENGSPVDYREATLYKQGAWFGN